MKIIPLSEAKANLRRYGDLCHEEPVIVTVDGLPRFQLAPLPDDDAVVDRLIERNAGFRGALEKRLAEPDVSVQEAIKRL